MDEVEGLTPLVQPRAFQVVHHEPAIRRDPGRLDRAEVIADNDCAGELVREVYGPYAGAGAHVEHALRVFRDGCAEEPAIQDEAEDVVFEIETVLLELIIRQ